MRASPRLAWCVLALCGCFAVSELPFDEPCRQARLAAVTRVWECTADPGAARSADQAWDDGYTCLITGWGGEALDTGFELGRRLDLDGGDSMSLPAALACGEAIRATTCETATLPLASGWVLGVSAECARILRGPAATGTTTNSGQDADQDGWAVPEDCNDADPLSHPGAIDLCYDGIDQDCAGNDDFDCDGDGVPLAYDCNDGDASNFPGNQDPVGDYVDTDCDGMDG